MLYSLLNDKNYYSKDLTHLIPFFTILTLWYEPIAKLKRINLQKVLFSHSSEYLLSPRKKKKLMNLNALFNKQILISISLLFWVKINQTKIPPIDASLPDINPLYKSFELDSIFTMVSNPRKTSIIVEYIYKHSSININEFNSDDLYELSKENKLKFLLGDFNINLINYDINPQTNEFLHSFLSHCFPLT